MSVNTPQKLVYWRENIVCPNYFFASLILLKLTKKTELINDALWPLGINYEKNIVSNEFSRVTILINRSPPVLIIIAFVACIKPYSGQFAYYILYYKALFSHRDNRPLSTHIFFYAVITKILIAVLFQCESFKFLFV